MPSPRPNHRAAKADICGQCLWHIPLLPRSGQTTESWWSNRERLFGRRKTGIANEYVDYAASKGAVDSLTVGLAKELAGSRVRVNAVRPGIIDTDIHADGGEAGRAHRIGPGLPLGRAGTTEDIAEAILWLVSDKSAFTTGQLIDVAGGL